MAAEIVNSGILPAQGQERIVIMDDYGSDLQLYVSVSDAANRQTLIDAAIAQQSANQTALEAYAAAHNIDLSAAKAAGEAKKAAARTS
jgi:uncharacterized protein YjfI (DUF2170 family)